MEKAKSFEVIVTNLNILRYIIYSKVKVGLYDVNKRSESFFCGLLNIVYDWQLENLNKESLTYPGIDLGSLSDKIGVQITSQNTSVKIEKTINLFEKNEHHKNFDRLIVFIITKKSNHSKRFVSEMVDFDKGRDILDIDDLLFYIEINLSLDKIKQIEQYILNEIPYYTASITSENDLLSHREDYQSIQPRTYEKMRNYFVKEGELKYLDKFIASSKEVFQKLNKVSKKQRAGLIVLLTKGENLEVNINTWADSLISSFNFNRSEIQQLGHALDRVQILYYNEDEYDPLMKVYDRDFWQTIEFVFSKPQIADMIMNLNFSILD